MTFNTRISKMALIIALSFFTLTGVANAQIKPSVEPGVVTRSLTEPLRQAPTVEDNLTSENQKNSQASGSTKAMFTLKGVVLEGSSIFNDKQVTELAENYIGKSVSFADLNSISQILTKKYREAGYLFSRAVLSPQTIKSGVVHFKAIEGRITEVTFVGDTSDDGTLRALADKIKSIGPANESEIERYLLLMNDLPGISARSLLQPSKTPGGGELVITVVEKEFEGSLAADNRGSRNLGPYRGTAVGALNNLFGLHDRTTVRGITTTNIEDLQFADITHEEQLGTEGTRLKGRFAITATEPGDNLRSFNIKGNSRLYDLELQHPFLRSRKMNFNLFAGFNALNSESELLGSNFAADRTRSVRSAGRFDFTDNWAGINQIELQITKGISIFDPTTDGLGRSRANGKHDFFRTNLNAVRVQDIGKGFSMQFAAAGQYSADPLLSSEEFAVGGSEFGRAYDSGELAGDSGLSGSVELRYSGAVDNQFIQDYQVYSFYDYGKVWNEKPSVAEAPTDSLSSAGVGVRFNLDQAITGSLEVSKPITRDVSAEGNRDPRVFFNVLKRF